MGLFLFLILHPIPNHSFLYSHMTVKIQYAQTQTVVCLKFKASHKKKIKCLFQVNRSYIISLPNKVDLST